MSSLRGQKTPSTQELQAKYQYLTLKERGFVNDLSSAIPRGSSVEMRILATHPPHPQAIPAHPTLEEAYLLFQEGMGKAEGTETFVSPKPV